MRQLLITANTCDRSLACYPAFRVFSSSRVPSKVRAGLCQRAKPATIAAHRGVKEPPAVTITARSRTSLPHRIVTEGSNNTASNLAANRKDQHCQLNTPCAYFRYVGPLRYVGAQAAQAHGSPALQPSAKPMIQHT